MFKIDRDIDEAGITRAAGLLAAFRDDDRNTWAGILATDYQGQGAATAMQTFAGVVVLAAALINSVADLRDEPAAQVVADHVAAVLDHLAQARQIGEMNDDDTTS